MPWSPDHVAVVGSEGHDGVIGDSELDQAFADAFDLGVDLRHEAVVAGAGPVDEAVGQVADPRLAVAVASLCVEVVLPVAQPAAVRLNVQVVVEPPLVLGGTPERPSSSAFMAEAEVWSAWAPARPAE
jgi:hypothetical protein